jgi:hypothetical protein
MKNQSPVFVATEPLGGDRAQLEKAEARILVPSYYRTVELLGKADAAVWLSKQIKRLERMYGYGFEARCRAYMRQVDDENQGIA